MLVVSVITRIRAASPQRSTPEAVFRASPPPQSVDSMPKANTVRLSESRYIVTRAQQTPMCGTIRGSIRNRLLRVRVQSVLEMREYAEYVREEI
jgi:hypothetical protein